MNQKPFDAAYELLSDELLDLAEEHQASFTPAQFAAILVQFAARLAYDCAPTLKDADNLLRGAQDSIRKEYTK